MSWVSTRPWVRRLGWCVGVLAVIAFVLEVYTRWPSQAVAESLRVPENATYVVLLLHGTGGRHEPILVEIAERFQQSIGRDPGVTVVRYVWSPWSDNRLRAGAHGAEIGRQIGTELAKLENLEHVRLIAHSAGAYVLDPLCEAFKAAVKEPAHIEMTFLDGMAINGAWDYSWGNRYYGACADFARANYTRGDPGPGTDGPLRNAYNLDVTAAPGRDGFSGGGHYWPLQYFLDALDPQEMTPGLRTHEEFPRGVNATRAPH